MYREYIKYFIGFLVTIGLIIVVIILLFGGGNDTKQTGSTDTKKLTDISDTDSKVRMTIAGNVRATQEYFEIQITSDSSSNNIQILQGYDHNVVDSQSFENNAAGYSTFLRALSIAGYSKGDTSKTLADDRGYCPLGQRYIFETIENGKVLSRYWTTSCGKSAPKTYLGTSGLTTTLFEKQIPGYSTITNKVDF